MVSRTEYISSPTGILPAALAFGANGSEAAAAEAMAVLINSRRVKSRGVRTLKFEFVIGDMLLRGSRIPKWEVQLDLRATGDAAKHRKQQRSVGVPQAGLGFFRGWRWLGLCCVWRRLRRRLSLLWRRLSGFLRLRGKDVKIAADIAHFN